MIKIINEEEFRELLASDANINVIANCKNGIPPTAIKFAGRGWVFIPKDQEKFIRLLHNCASCPECAKKVN